LLELNTSDVILTQNKILTRQLEALTAQISKLPQQLQVVQSSQSHTQLIRCDFCRGNRPNGHCSYQNNSSEVEINYMSNQGRQGGHHGKIYASWPIKKIMKQQSKI